MKKCPACKAENDTESLECSRCGLIFEKWEKRQAAPSSPKSLENDPLLHSSSSNLINIVGYVFLSVVGIFCLYVLAFGISYRFQIPLTFLVIVGGFFFSLPFLPKIFSIFSPGSPKNHGAGNPQKLNGPVQSGSPSLQTPTGITIARWSIIGLGLLFLIIAVVLANLPVMGKISITFIGAFILMVILVLAIQSRKKWSKYVLVFYSLITGPMAIINFFFSIPILFFMGIISMSKIAQAHPWATLSVFAGIFLLIIGKGIFFTRFAFYLLLSNDAKTYFDS